MMVSKQLILLFLCFSTLLQAQQNNFGRTYSNSLPDEFRLDAPMIRDYVFQNIPEYYKKGTGTKWSYQFADFTSLQVADLVASGKVYSDWQEFEDYLNEIFRKVIPEELQDNKMIHAYLQKEGRYNAFMTPTGMTFFNVGLFGYMTNEAMIAGVLAHELAHYHLQHSLQRYLKQQRGQLKEQSVDKNRDLSTFSISIEAQADSLAMIWMLNSGYHLKGLEQSFKVMDALSKNTLLKYEKKWALKATSHPLSKDRLANIQAFIREHKEAPGEFFLVDKDRFTQLMEEAKPEILKHLLSSFDYDLCIENAFKFHIYDVENPIYVYYLLEGIRRKCYLNTDNWKKNFITDQYYKIVNNDDVLTRKKVKIDDHLFKKIPVEILCLDVTTLKNVEARFYWKEVKFTTYEEAFEFFFKISEVYKDTESILSYALSITHNKEARNKYLTKYLENENIQYRAYAESLLNGEIVSSLENKKLTLLANFYTAFRQKNNDIIIRDGTKGKDSQLANLYGEVMSEFKNRNSMMMEDFTIDQLNDYSLLRELQQFSASYTISKGIKTELHVLDPRYWQIMKKHGVNEIEFISGIYTEINNRQTTYEDYKTIIQQDFNTALNTKKTLKYFQLFLTSVREIDDGIMKVRYYGGDNKLKNKEKGYDQVVEYMKALVAGKDNKNVKYSDEFDRNYTISIYGRWATPNNF